MKQHTKRLNLISRIKSIVKRGRSTPLFKPDEDMSKDFANKIQSSSYNLTKNYKKTNTYTSTYIKISEQLSVEDNQIFCAAVYNLAKIAINDQKYRNEILEILNKNKETFSDNEEKFSYLSNKIEEIEKAS